MTPEDELAALREEVRRLTDREAIRDVFTRFAAAMDVQDWNALARVFSPDIVFDHSRRTWKGDLIELWEGHEEVMARTKEGVSRHVAAQHIISNEQIVVAGDRARATAYLHSVHLDDRDHAEVHGDHGAWYLAELQRGDDGWRLSRLRHIATWRSGALQPDGPITDAEIAAVRDHLA